MTAESTRTAIARGAAGIRLRKTRQDPRAATDPTPGTRSDGLRGVVARPSRAPAGARLGRDNGNSNVNDERARPNYTLDGTPTVCLNAADTGKFRAMIDQYGVIVTELYDVNVPDAWKNSEGRVGVILGLSETGAASVPSEIVLPLEPIRVVNVKLLTLAELEFAAKQRAEGRAELARRFQAAPGAQRSSLSRPSVV